MKFLPPLASAALLVCGCSTPKVAASEAFGPELTVHTVPEGAEIFRDGRSLGLAPVNVPVKSADATLSLEAHLGGYQPAKATLDAKDLRQQGGGESWMALKPETMGTDAPAIDATKAADLDKGGVALSKAKRCKEALQFFGRAIALDGRYPKARRDRAHCYAALHQWDAAATDLEVYLSIVPDAPDAQKVIEEISKLRGGREMDLAPAEQTGGGSTH
ncbi:MAG: tetratricopeptide repeat protein [Deltaproteobacteria bacterium]|nr:tetratricopeptide repeat protein [Deltaproteobacteria bacterium]